MSQDIDNKEHAQQTIPTCETCHIKKTFRRRAGRAECLSCTRKRTHGKDNALQARRE